MFVQMISMQAPLGKIEDLRKLLLSEYLPALENRPGFITAHLLEQVDDRDSAHLMIYWSNQRALEATETTGVLAGSTTSIVARMPGLRVQRQSYIATMTVRGREEIERA